MIRRLLLVLGVSLMLAVTARAELELDLDTLVQAAEERPDDLRIRIILARRYLQQGEPVLASRYLDQVRAADANYPALRQIESQLRAAQAEKAMLRAVGIENPHDMMAVTHAVQRLDQEGATGQLDQLLAWLKAQGFVLAPEVQVVHVKRLIAAERYEEVVQATAENQPSAADDLIVFRGQACHTLYKTECAIRDFSALWTQHAVPEYGDKLAQNLLRQGRLSEARAVIEQLRQLQPVYAGLPELEQAYLQAAEEQEAQLRARYKKERSGESVRALAALLYGSERQTEARTLLWQHMDKQPDDLDTGLQAARFDIWAGHYPRAVAYLSSLPQPDDASRLLLGKALAWSGEPERADTLFAALVKESSDTGVKDQSQLMLGYLRLWRNQKQEALTYLEPLLQRDTPDINRKELEEAVAQARGDMSALIAQAQTRLAEAPGDTDALLKLAQYQEKQGAAAQAISYYSSYLALVPDDSSARLALGRLYLKQRDYENGFIHLERYGFQLYTDESLMVLARNYHWAARDADAQRVLKALLTKSPQHKEAQVLSRQLVQRGGGRSGGNMPADPQALKQADQRYFAQDYGAAVEHYRAYLQRYSAPPDVHERYAFALEQLGYNTEAASEYYIVTRGGNSSFDTRFHYAFNLSRSGNYRAAREELMALLYEMPPVPEQLPLPQHLEHFLKSWSQSWASRDFARYSAHYAPAFNNDKKWRNHKQGLFSRNTEIGVEYSGQHLTQQREGEDVAIYQVRFLQDYRADKLKDQGYKTLEIRCAANRCLIEKEIWHGRTVPGADPHTRKLRELIERELEHVRLSELELSPGDKELAGIQMSTGVEKHLKGETDVFSQARAQSIALDGRDPVALFLAQDLALRYVPKEAVQRYIAYRQRYFSDSDDTEFRLPLLSAAWPLDAGQVRLAGGEYSFASPGCGKKKGYTLDVTLDRPWGEFGLMLDELMGETYLSPYMALTLDDSWQLSLFSRMLFFDKLSCGSLEEAVQKYGVRLSRYQALDEGDSLWYAAELGSMDDGNADMTAMFDYAFFQWAHARLDLTASLDGWYHWNREETALYYSPSFYDSTRLSAKTTLLLPHHLQLRADTRIGYTFSDARTLYAYGLWLNYPLRQGLESRIGCESSNASGAASGNDYSSRDCRFEVQYSW